MQPTIAPQIPYVRTTRAVRRVPQRWRNLSRQVDTSGSTRAVKDMSTVKKIMISA
jgi:hypothetical protein